jgi:hypothetical protein
METPPDRWGQPANFNRFYQFADLGCAAAFSR